MKTRPRSSPRRFSRFLVRAVLALSAARAAAADAVTIRLGTILPSGIPQHALLLELGERWRKDSNGAVKLTVFADGRLGGEAEMVKKMRIGQLNAGLFSAIGLAAIDPSVTGLQLIPLAFRSWDEVDYVREKMRPLFEARLRAKGFEVLCWADAGWARLFSKTAAFTPDDFRRTKVFVWAGDEPQAALMRATGFRPIPLETTDLLLGLNTDLITSAPLPPIVALASQIYGPASHMLDIEWAPIVGAAVVRTDAWEKTPAAIRAALKAAAEEIGGKIRTRGRTEDTEAVRVMAQRGLHVHAPTPEIHATWEQLAEQLQPHIRGKTVPADIFEAVQQHVREFRAAKSAAK